MSQVRCRRAATMQRKLAGIAVWVRLKSLALFLMGQQLGPDLVSFDGKVFTSDLADPHVEADPDSGRSHRCGVSSCLLNFAASIHLGRSVSNSNFRDHPTLDRRRNHIQHQLWNDPFETEKQAVAITLLIHSYPAPTEGSSNETAPGLQMDHIKTTGAETISRVRSRRSREPSVCICQTA